MQIGHLARFHDLPRQVVADDFALFFHVLILAIGVLVVLLSPAYLRANGSERGEYYTLVLFSIVGMLGLVIQVASASAPIGFHNFASKYSEIDRPMAARRTTARTCVSIDA